MFGCDGGVLIGWKHEMGPSDWLWIWFCLFPMIPLNGLPEWASISCPFSPSFHLRSVYLPVSTFVKWMYTCGSGNCVWCVYVCHQNEGWGLRCFSLQGEVFTPLPPASDHFSSYKCTCESLTWPDLFRSPSPAEHTGLWVLSNAGYHKTDCNWFSINGKGLWKRSSPQSKGACWRVKTMRC